MHHDQEKKRTLYSSVCNGYVYVYIIYSPRADEEKTAILWTLRCGVSNFKRLYFRHLFLLLLFRDQYNTTKKTNIVYIRVYNIVVAKTFIAEQNTLEDSILPFAEHRKFLRMRTTVKGTKNNARNDSPYCSPCAPDNLRISLSFLRHFNVRVRITKKFVKLKYCIRYMRITI